jgi:3'-phosphoadenosine 5'-phosphosulfate sulfotransferase (PAPS reductase)/FAD synthetase
MTTDEIKARLAGRRVVASVSGGKDSAAMSLYLTELGIEHDRVFCDTGWEHDLTYEYLRGPLVEKLGPITWLEPKRKMEELVRHKGVFPHRLRRFCTTELKVEPLARYMNARVDAGEEIVSAAGIRAAESEARAKMPEWEWQPSFDCEVWRPILRWSEQDVIDIHHRHALRPNPLYLQGAERVGCWPCIYARKSEVRLVADTDPSRIDRLRILEAQVADTAQARAKTKGEALKMAPAFFSAKTGGGHEAWPIDRVVEWSRTSRGGVQPELFAADPRDAGCMRWGLCDTNGRKE